MELTITFDDAEHLIRATYEGPYSLCDAQTTFPAILEALVQHKAQKVLVDARKVTGAPTTAERFDYSTFISQAVLNLTEQGIYPLPRFAYVLIEPVRDREYFGETVAVNRGMPVKVFGTVEEAGQWLNQPQHLLL